MLLIPLDEAGVEDLAFVRFAIAVGVLGVQNVGAAETRIPFCQGKTPVDKGLRETPWLCRSGRRRQCLRGNGSARPL